MIKKILFLFLCGFFLFHPSQINASERLNNKFGIHLAQPHLEALKQAARLVNSTGGDWGYVTLVMQEDDRDKQKWQEIFDTMRSLHLIPIIRLATKPDGDNWRRPNKEDAGQWAEFLDSLHWVVKERYITLFNEPNHAREWGGDVNPEHYGEVALEFGKKLKERNADFFVMLAGLDASAPSASPAYEDEEVFLKRMITAGSVDEWRRIISGLSSHSYPNPAFSGSVWDTGRGSIRTYQWELQLLKELGISNNLLVFITETGWECRSLSREAIGEYYQQAFEYVWGPDQRVVAVTPFVFDYPAEPFIGFSWKQPSGEDYYPQYFTVQNLSKTCGDPEQEEKGRATIQLPKELVESSSFLFTIKLKNLGQSIWEKDYGYELKLDNFSGGTYSFSDLKPVAPFQETEVRLHVKTNKMEDKGVENKAVLSLYKQGKKVIDFGVWDSKIVALPTLSFQVSLYPKAFVNDSGFELQIFDKQENLLFKKSRIQVKDGNGQVGDVQNIALGEPYRAVLLKKYYLPRQVIVSFKQGANTLKFKRMFPLDFNHDGAFTWKDIGALTQNLNLLSLFTP